MRRSLLLLALASISFAAACSDNNPAPAPTDGGKTPQPWHATGVGASGAFVQTFDDVAWRSRSLSDLTLYAIVCVGQKLGWTVGARGSIAHTTDGGATWSWQSSGVTSDLHAVRFADANRGFAVGDGGTTITTSDGGLHWTVASATTIDLRSAALSSDSWLAVGANGTVLRSIDGGRTWSTSKIEGAANLRGVDVDAGGHVVLAVDDAGAIWSSTDGVSFVRESVAPSPLESVAVDPGGGSAVAAGARGTILLRDPATHAWTQNSLQNTVDLRAALVLAQGTRFVVAGESGTMLTRTLSSPTWSPIALGTSSAIFGLEDL